MCFKFISLMFLICAECLSFQKPPDNKRKCPTVRALKNMDLEQGSFPCIACTSNRFNSIIKTTFRQDLTCHHQILGKWYVVQYYASSEEALPYRCMQAEFTMSPHPLEITMNFTYSFTDDPLNEKLYGNITWTMPNPAQHAHWIHSEDTYEGVYNTYVVDSDYGSWALLLHCAEKSKSPRYLSSFIMSRLSTLGINVISYLRDKLPRYDIDLTYMFEMKQKDCDVPQFGIDIPPSILMNRSPSELRRHPLKRHRRKN